MSGENKCPLCGKRADAAHRPFCSRHCADVDLHRWLGGGYRIETDETPEPGEPIPLNPEDNRTR
jgi:endogenous inhibitor of DNA gyrase (YacG/DUF329 family)